MMIGFRHIALPDSLSFSVCNVKTASLLDIFDSQQVLHTVLLLLARSLCMAQHDFCFNSPFLLSSFFLVEVLRSHIPFILPPLHWARV